MWYIFLPFVAVAESVETPSSIFFSELNLWFIIFQKCLLLLNYQKANKEFVSWFMSPPFCQTACLHLLDQVVTLQIQKVHFLTCISTLTCRTFNKKCSRNTKTCIKMPFWVSWHAALYIDTRAIQSVFYIYCHLCLVSLFIILSVIFADCLLC